MRWLAVLALLGCGAAPPTPPCQCRGAQDFFIGQFSGADGGTWPGAQCYCRPRGTVLGQQPMDVPVTLDCETGSRLFADLCAGQGLPIR